MTGFEIGATIFAGATLVFAVGFLLGISCQWAEDRRAMRRMSAASKKALQEAHREAETAMREKVDVEWRLALANPSTPCSDEDLVFGDGDQDSWHWDF